METLRLVLTRWERDVFELVLRRPVVEGDKILGAEVIFAEEPKRVGFWASLKGYLRLAKDG